MKNHIITAVFAASAALSLAGPAEEAAAHARGALDMIAKGDIKSVFLALPASYQADVAGVVKAAAGKMDADIFKGVGETMQAFAQVGIAKPEIVVQMITPRRGGDDFVPPNAAGVTAAATALKGLAGKLSLDALKGGDIAGILSNPEVAALVSAAAKDTIAKVKVTGSREKPNGGVTVYVQEADGEIDDVDYRMIEGKWVSEEVYDDWKEDVREIMRGIDRIKIGDTEKQQILAMFPMMKTALDGAAKAADANQMRSSLLMALMPFMMSGIGGAGGIDFD